MAGESTASRPAVMLEKEWRVGTYEWWPSADRLIWSPELVRIYGLKDHPEQEETFTALVHPEDRARVEGETSAYLGSDAQSYSHTFRIVRPDGAVRVILDRGAIERDAAGAACVVRGINIDVTEDTLPGPGPGGRGGSAPEPEKEAVPEAALLEALFDSAPVGLGIWDSDFRFRRINGALAAINGLPPEAHIGHRPDEILPHIADLDGVYRNWSRILDTGVPLRGAEVTGETPAEPGRGRSWQEDFFALRVGARNVGIAAVVQETTRRTAAERELLQSKTRQRALFDAIDEGFCVLEVCLDAPDGRIDYRVVDANPAFYERTGFPKAIFGRWLREAAPDLEEHWFEIYGGVARTGEPNRFEQGSDMLGRWFDVYAFPIDAPEDCRIAVLFSDISERKRHEEQTRMLLHEVDHRSKNLLGLVRAIARQTASTGASDFVERFSERIMALASAHDLLIRNSWKTVPVEDLIRSQLAHFSDLVGDRIKIAGPALSLTADVTQALGMAVHELATNAAKYGALSNAAGRICVRWSVEADESGAPLFVLSWQERDGPPVEAPQRSGFGSRVTTDMVEASTEGKVSVDYAPAGLDWRICCRAATVLVQGLDRGAPDKAGARGS